MLAFGDLEIGDLLWFYDMTIGKERAGVFIGVTDFGDPYRVLIDNNESPFDIPEIDLERPWFIYGGTLIYCDEVFRRFGPG